MSRTGPTGNVPEVYQHLISNELTAVLTLYQFSMHLLADMIALVFKKQPTIPDSNSDTDSSNTLDSPLHFLIYRACNNIIDNASMPYLKTFLLTTLCLCLTDSPEIVEDKGEAGLAFGERSPSLHLALLCRNGVGDSEGDKSWTLFSLSPGKVCTLKATLPSDRP